VAAFLWMVVFERSADASFFLFWSEMVFVTFLMKWTTAPEIGSVRVVASQGDALLSLVRRARRAAEKTAQAVGADSPVAHSLRTAAFGLAKAALAAPAEGPARSAVVMELSPRIRAMEAQASQAISQVAIASKQAWRTAASTALEEVDETLNRSSEPKNDYWHVSAEPCVPGPPSPGATPSGAIPPRP